ncbi:MAG TPA: hypothetical protein DIU48_15085, partial [Acidobacteria bacterium]|nr:hypothetical protein [Acidobacteriota bacterium]
AFVAADTAVAAAKQLRFGDIATRIAARNVATQSLKVAVMHTGNETAPQERDMDWSRRHDAGWISTPIDSNTHFNSVVTTRKNNRLSVADHTMDGTRTETAAHPGRKWQ